METIDVTLAERGQIVIPKEARDALGLKPGRLLIEKKVQLDLSRWVGRAVDDGLTSEQALSELRGRPVPWQAADEKNNVSKSKPTRLVKPAKRPAR